MKRIKIVLCLLLICTICACSSSSSTSSNIKKGQYYTCKLQMSGENNSFKSKIYYIKKHAIQINIKSVNNYSTASKKDYKKMKADQQKVIDKYNDTDGVSSELTDKDQIMTITVKVNLDDYNLEDDELGMFNKSIIKDDQVLLEPLISHYQSLGNTCEENK